MIIHLKDKRVKYNRCFIAPGAVVAGDVSIGDRSSIWYGAVVRGDDNKIFIGENSNIQDNCTVHVHTNFPTIIGDNVSVGHHCTLHGCTIEDNCIIGMGSVIMDNTVIGKNTLVGAGTVITSGKRIPQNSVVYGNPFKIVRNITEDEIKNNIWNANHYCEEALEHMECLENRCYSK